MSEQVPRTIIGKIASIHLHTTDKEIVGHFHPLDKIANWDEGEYTKNVAARQMLLDLGDDEVIKTTLCLIEDSTIAVGDIPESYISGYDSFYKSKSPYIINYPTYNSDIILDSSIDPIVIINKYIDNVNKPYPTKFALNMYRDENVDNGKIITSNRIVCTSAL